LFNVDERRPPEAVLKRLGGKDIHLVQQSDLKFAEV